MMAGMRTGGRIIRKMMKGSNMVSPFLCIGFGWDVLSYLLIRDQLVVQDRGVAFVMKCS